MKSAKQGEITLWELKNTVDLGGLGFVLKEKPVIKHFPENIDESSFWGQQLAMNNLATGRR